MRYLFIRSYIRGEGEGGVFTVAVPCLPYEIINESI